jgi:outer membrane protein assembly factor BamB
MTRHCERSEAIQCAAPAVQEDFSRPWRVRWIAASLTLLAMTIGLTACSSLPSWMGGEKRHIERLPGDRLAVLPPSQNFVADSAVLATTFVLPPPIDNVNWPQHTGVLTATTGNIAFAGTLENRISAKIGDGEKFDRPLVPGPVVTNNVVFAMDAVGKISAHDAANIDNKRWESAGVSEEDEPNVLGGGLAVSEGKLFATSGRGVIAAFDATSGKELWKKSLRTPFRSAPRIADNKLLAITTDSQLFAFNSENGEVLWSHRGIGETASLMNSVSPAVSGGDVIVPYASGEIYSLSAADGNQLWSDSLAAPGRTLASSSFSGIGGDPVVDGDFVFAVSSSGKLAVFALATGQKIWEKPISAINTPWVAGDYLFVLTSDNNLICFVKYTGAVRWSVKLPSYENEAEKEDSILWRGPILLVGKLIVVGSQGEMKIINAADGKILDTKDIPEGIITAPVVAGGRVYLVGQDATLYSLQ